MLTFAIEAVAWIVCLAFCLAAAVLALAVWAFATSLPIAALWACFRLWCRLFGV